MQKEALNLFTSGLVMDLNPMTTPNDVLTNCLNGTILTNNGNENILQNDMGNGRVELAFLPEGYMPVGTCEFGDIIYVVSYNPLIDKAQIGCFPSPERNTTREERKGLQQSVSWTDFQESYDGENPTGKLTALSLKKEIYPDSKNAEPLNPGDKFIIYSNKEDYADNKNCITDLGNTSHTINDFPQFVKVSVVLFQENGKIIYLDSTMKWYEQSNTLDYFIPNLQLNSDDTPNIDSYRNVLNSGYTILKSKHSGKLGLLIELETIKGFSCTHKLYKTESSEGESTKKYLSPEENNSSIFTTTDPNIRVNYIRSEVDSEGNGSAKNIFTFPNYFTIKVSNSEEIKIKPDTITLQDSYKDQVLQYKGEHTFSIKNEDKLLKAQTTFNASIGLEGFKFTMLIELQDGFTKYFINYNKDFIEQEETSFVYKKCYKSVSTLQANNIWSYNPSFYDDITLTIKANTLNINISNSNNKVHLINIDNGEWEEEGDDYLQNISISDIPYNRGSDEETGKGKLIFSKMYYTKDFRLESDLVTGRKITSNDTTITTTQTYIPTRKIHVSGELTNTDLQLQLQVYNVMDELLWQVNWEKLNKSIKTEVNSVQGSFTLSNLNVQYVSGSIGQINLNWDMVLQSDNSQPLSIDYATNTAYIYDNIDPDMDFGSSTGVITTLVVTGNFKSKDGYLYNSTDQQLDYTAKLPHVTTVISMFNRDDIKKSFESSTNQNIQYSSFGIQLERVNRETSDGNKYYGSDVWYNPIRIENLHIQTFRRESARGITIMGNLGSIELLERKQEEDSSIYINNDNNSCCKIVWEDSTRSKIVHIEFYLINNVLQASHSKELNLFLEDNSGSPLYRAQCIYYKGRDVNLQLTDIDSITSTSVATSSNELNSDIDSTISTITFTYQYNQNHELEASLKLDNVSLYTKSHALQKWNTFDSISFNMFPIELVSSAPKIYELNTTDLIVDSSANTTLKNLKITVFDDKNIELKADLIYRVQDENEDILTNFTVNASTFIDIPSQIQNTSSSEQVTTINLVKSFYITNNNNTTIEIGEIKYKSALQDSVVQTYDSCIIDNITQNDDTYYGENSKKGVSITYKIQDNTLIGQIDRDGISIPFKTLTPIQYITYNDTYQVWLDYSWETDNMDVNPSYLYFTTPLQWINKDENGIATIKYEIENQEQVFNVAPPTNTLTDNCLQTDITYDLGSKENYTKFQEVRHTQAIQNLLNTEVDPENEPSYNIKDIQISQYGISRDLTETDEKYYYIYPYIDSDNAFKYKLKDGSTRTAQSLHVFDNILNNYYHSSILTKIGEVTIPRIQSEENGDIITYWKDSSNLKLEYNVCPAMPFGYLDNLKCSNIIDFSRINYTINEVTTWKYMNNGDSCQLHLGLESNIAPSLGKGVESVHLKFYDNQGLAAVMHIRNRNSYSGLFIEHFLFNSSANKQIDNFDNFDNKFYHAGEPYQEGDDTTNLVYWSQTENEAVIKCYYFKQGSSWSDNTGFYLKQGDSYQQITDTKNIYHNNAGVIYQNFLYKVDIVFSIGDINALGKITPPSNDANNYHVYKWMWTNELNNQYFNEFEDFSYMNPQLTMDMQVLFSSSGTETMDISDLQINGEAKEGDIQDGCRTTIVNGTMCMQIEPIFENNFNTFSLYGIHGLADTSNIRVYNKNSIVSGGVYKANTPVINYPGFLATNNSTSIIKANIVKNTDNTIDIVLRDIKLFGYSWGTVYNGEPFSFKYIKLSHIPANPGHSNRINYNKSQVEIEPDDLIYTSDEISVGSEQWIAYNGNTAQICLGINSKALLKPDKSLDSTSLAIIFTISTNVENAQKEDLSEGIYSITNIKIYPVNKYYQHSNENPTVRYTNDSFIDKNLSISPIDIVNDFTIQATTFKGLNKIDENTGTSYKTDALVYMNSQTHELIEDLQAKYYDIPLAYFKDASESFNYYLKYKSPFKALATITSEDCIIQRSWLTPEKLQKLGLIEIEGNIFAKKAIRVGAWGAAKGRKAWGYITVEDFDLNDTGTYVFKNKQDVFKYQNKDFTKSLQEIANEPSNALTNIKNDTFFLLQYTTDDSHKLSKKNSKGHEIVGGYFDHLPIVLAYKKDNNIYALNYVVQYKGNISNKKFALDPLISMLYQYKKNINEQIQTPTWTDFVYFNPFSTTYFQDFVIQPHFTKELQHHNDYLVFHGAKYTDYLRLVNKWCVGSYVTNNTDIIIRHATKTHPTSFMVNYVSPLDKRDAQPTQYFIEGATGLINVSELPTNTGIYINGNGVGNYNSPQYLPLHTKWKLVESSDKAYLYPSINNDIIIQTKQKALVDQDGNIDTDAFKATNNISFHAKDDDYTQIANAILYGSELIESSINQAGMITTKYSM